MAIEGMEGAAREIGARKLEKLTRVNGVLRVDSYDKSALLTPRSIPRRHRCPPS